MTLSKQIAREATTAWLMFRSNMRQFVLLGITLLCLILVVLTRTPRTDVVHPAGLHTGADGHDAIPHHRAEDVFDHDGDEPEEDTVKVPLGKRAFDEVTVSDCGSRLPVNAGRTYETHVKGVHVSFAGWTANESFAHEHVALRTHDAVRIMSKFTRAATLLDVGANIGKVTFPVMAMRATHTVVAVEPVGKNVNSLCMTANLNGWLGRPGLLLLQAAMSDKDGKVEMYVPEGREDNSALNREAAVANVGDSESAESVRVLVGDEVLEQGEFAPDVIKVDTQGHEIHVLRGLRKYLHRSEPGAVVVMAESDTKLMRMSGVEPVEVYNLMVDELGYEAYCRPDVDVVDNELKVTGTPLTKELYPPGGCKDLFYFKQPR